MSVRPTAGTTLATWSGKALLITAGVTLVAAIFWYSRAATVPMIIGALVVTQLYPLVDWMGRRGVSRGIAIAVTLLAMLLLVLAAAWLFVDSLFAQLGAIGHDISKGADTVVDWLSDNSRWVKDHEEQIREFLASIL